MFFSDHYSGPDSRHVNREQASLLSIMLSLLHHVSLVFHGNVNEKAEQFHLARALAMVCLIQAKSRETDPVLYLIIKDVLNKIRLIINSIAGTRLTRDVECDHEILLQRRWPYDKTN